MESLQGVSLRRWLPLYYSVCRAAAFGCRQRRSLRSPTAEENGVAHRGELSNAAVGDLAAFPFHFLLSFVCSPSFFLYIDHHCLTPVVVHSGFSFCPLPPKKKNTILPVARLGLLSLSLFYCLFTVIHCSSKASHTVRPRSSTHISSSFCSLFFYQEKER